MNSLIKNFVTKLWSKQETYQSLDIYYQKVILKFIAQIINEFKFIKFKRLLMRIGIGLDLVWFINHLVTHLILTAKLIMP